MELEQIWEEALKMIEEETSPVSFATWIQPIVPCGIIGNKIILQVKESFLKEIIEKRHLPLIRTAIKMVTKNEYDIMITTEEEQKAGNLHNLAAEKPAENELARNLNPKYVFDSFVVGNSNRMAHAASLAVAESPAQAYNPLFLYGNSGLGKTHLMHSIGHFILDRNPQAKVLYVTSETFTNELINSIQNNKNEEFRNKYRNIDVLMIDDMGVEPLMENITIVQWFNLINERQLRGKGTVISTNLNVEELRRRYTERITSRLMDGKQCMLLQFLGDDVRRNKA